MIPLHAGRHRVDDVLDRGPAIGLVAREGAVAEPGTTIENIDYLAFGLPMDRYEQRALRRRNSAIRDLELM